MPGIGKSVLAAEVARDPEVRSKFIDGIFWLSLGINPMLTCRQSDLAELLGDRPLPFEDVQQGRIHLSKLLGRKSCLIILDDVWNAEDVKALNVLGENWVVYVIY